MKQDDAQWKQGLANKESAKLDQDFLKKEGSDKDIPQKEMEDISIKGGARREKDLAEQEGSQLAQDTPKIESDLKLDEDRQKPAFDSSLQEPSEGSGKLEQEMPKKMPESSFQESEASGATWADKVSGVEKSRGVPFARG